MLLRPAEALLNKGQTMPQKRAAFLPSKLQACVQANSETPGEVATNSARTLLQKAATSAHQVLEKCAPLKQAWGYRPYFRPPMGYHPMGYQGYYPEERTLAAQPAQTLFRPTTCFGCEPTTPRLVWKAFLPPAAHRVAWLREPSAAAGAGLG
jgi:hypothetical protein